MITVYRSDNRRSRLSLLAECVEEKYHKNRTVTEFSAAVEF